jgi:transcriptional regulator with XRE-family HTH domain
VHEYRRFVQAELDARGWKPAELARRAGLHRQLVWKILHDQRPALGQMPEESTMEGIARGFGISVDRVRVAAARALRGYEDDGQPLTNDLSDVSIDALLAEIRRRVEVAESSLGARVGVPVVVEDERKYFGTFERERVGDAPAGEAAGEDR